MNNNDKGFTLIELVVVIVVLTILAVSAIPRFNLTQDYSLATDRDQLISLLISIQTRAMQNTDDTDCYRVAIIAGDIGMVGQNPNGTCNNLFTTNSDSTDGFLVLRPENNVSIVNGANTGVTAISFDSLGRPIPQTNYAVRFGNVNSVCIESEGYIHVC